MEESISVSLVLSCLLETAGVKVKCRETQMNIPVHVAYTKIPLQRDLQKPCAQNHKYNLQREKRGCASASEETLERSVMALPQGRICPLQKLLTRKQTLTKANFQHVNIVFLV